MPTLQVGPGAPRNSGGAATCVNLCSGNMNYVGIDLPKNTIRLGVVNPERQVLERRRFYCNAPEQ
jgi:hypothetical protein